MDKVKLGEKIQTLRKSLGIKSQDDFGAKAGVSVRVIKEVEAGKGNTTVDNLELVLNALKIDFNRHMLEMVPDPTAKKAEIVAPPVPLESIQKDLKDIKATLNQKTLTPSQQELFDLLGKLSDVQAKVFIKAIKRRLAGGPGPDKDDSDLDTTD